MKKEDSLKYKVKLSVTAALLSAVFITCAVGCVKDEGEGGQTDSSDGGNATVGSFSFSIPDRPANGTLPDKLNVFTSTSGADISSLLGSIGDVTLSQFVKPDQSTANNQEPVPTEAGGEENNGQGGEGLEYNTMNDAEFVIGADTSPTMVYEFND